MEIFPALLAICAGNSRVTGDFPHKGQWRWALMFSLICAWTNRWANNGDTIALIKNVIVMVHDSVSRIYASRDYASGYNQSGVTFSSWLHQISQQNLKIEIFIEFGGE